MKIKIWEDDEDSPNVQLKKVDELNIPCVPRTGEDIDINGTLLKIKGVSYDIDEDGMLENVNLFI